MGGCFEKNISFLEGNGWLGRDGNATPVGGFKSGAALWRHLIYLNKGCCKQRQCCIASRLETEHPTDPKKERLLRLQLRTMIVEVPLVVQEALLVFFQVLPKIHPLWWPSSAMLWEAHVKSLGRFRSTRGSVRSKRSLNHISHWKKLKLSKHFPLVQPIFFGGWISLTNSGTQPPVKPKKIILGDCHFPASPKEKYTKPACPPPKKLDPIPYLLSHHRQPSSMDWKKTWFPKHHLRFFTTASALLLLLRQQLCMFFRWVAQDFLDVLHSFLAGTMGRFGCISIWV